MTDVKLPEPAAVFHVQLFRECPSMRNVDLVERQEFSAGSHDLFTADQLTAAVMVERERCETLQGVCAEAYQVVGALGDVDDPQVVKALDNLSAAANGDPIPHDDVLPFTVMADRAERRRPIDSYKQRPKVGSEKWPHTYVSA